MLVSQPLGIISKLGRPSLRPRSDIVSQRERDTALETHRVRRNWWKVSNMKMIGLIGGMSWESSAEYYRILNEGVRERLGPTASARSEERREGTECVRTCRSRCLPYHE